MSITVECQRCGKGYRVGDDKAGLKMKCKGCDSIVVIPEVDFVFDDEVEEVDEPFESLQKQSSVKNTGYRSMKVQLIGGTCIVLFATVAVIVILNMRGLMGKDKKPEVQAEETRNVPRPDPRFNPRGTDVVVQWPSFLLSEKPVPFGQQCRLTITELHTELELKHESAVLWSPDFRAIGRQNMGDGPMLINPPAAAPMSISAKEFEPLIHISSRLERIGRAMGEYHNKWGAYPASYQRGHGLSWRVHLLPMLGEEELFKKFNLEEPWDSPHNKKLLAEMPDVFKSTGVAETGKTSIHVFVGQGTPFGPAPKKHCEYEYRMRYRLRNARLEPNARYRFSLKVFADSTFTQPEFEETRELSGAELMGKTDFTWRFKREQPAEKGEPTQSKEIKLDTICAVGAGPETAAEWTKPGGLKIDTFNPVVNLGTIPRTGLPIVYFNGIFASLPAVYDQRTIIAMAQHKDPVFVKPLFGANLVYSGKSEKYAILEEKARQSENLLQRLLEVLKSVEDAASARIAAARISQITEEFKQASQAKGPLLSDIEQQILKFQTRMRSFEYFLLYNREDARALLRSGNEPKLKQALERLKSTMEEIRNKKTQPVI